MMNTHRPMCQGCAEVLQAFMTQLSFHYGKKPTGERQRIP